jgi:hypothetical protein
MRVAVYDKNPGAGFSQRFLAFTWLVGCFLHKLFGKLDDYKACSSWDEAIGWLLSREGTLTSIQFWGHGSPGALWNNGKAAYESTFLKLKPKVTRESIIWFRACSVFQGQRGWDFSRTLANGLGCTVAGHTRIIGLLQGGLHTRQPNQSPIWPITEGELSGPLAKSGMAFGNKTIFCLRATVPPGW